MIKVFMALAGEPEKLASFKNGIAHLAKRHPDIPVTPVYMHGLGKALPRGEALFVPFFCDVFVGESLVWQGSKNGYMRQLEEAIQGLKQEGHFAAWE